MIEIRKEILEWLKDNDFIQHAQKPNLYMRVMDNETVAYVDFRKLNKGRRYFTKGLDIRDDPDSLHILCEFKTFRDTFLGIKAEEPTKDIIIQPAQPHKRSDAEIDNMIETAKAKRFLESRGTSYVVQGKERPDAHKIQQIANDRKISIELIEAEQTEDYCQVIVRGNLGKQFIDAVVHHDYKTEYLLKAMEIIKKNPEILDHYEGTTPIIKEGSKVKQGDQFIDAKYYLVHTLLSFKKFSLRDARTKAAANAEAMLLNRDWRDEDEIKSEMDEKDLIESRR